ncbi:MAG: MBL fold metallo-hydrolase [Gammaproteobacteria bacterium]|nr:MBL fold metallo-hydrolase [Gammaproteobacteria bacterium]MBT8152267.1 MBL fold metallo-hydrolase [Gammaproteobacteria bacterium]NNM11250.1 MBL fold metallo-hydrolase [Pseudomonadales bacterium]
MSFNFRRTCVPFIALFIAQFYSLCGLAADAEKKSAITSQKITDDIYMLSGDGGNIGVLIGDDGTFMIDDKFARLSDDIMSSIKKLGGTEPDYLVNTHFHADHTGGNESFGKAGSTIVAHHSVRARLTTKTEIAAFDMVTPPQPKDALPVITFSKDMRLHINGHTLSITHVPAAHTDGDSIVHFVEANVIHTGDVFFNGLFPFIDVTHRGSLGGMISATDKVLSIANAQTKIIPGHGPLASLSDLQDYRNMLATAEKRLSVLKKRGMKAKDIIAAKPLQDMDAKWGNGMFKSDRWIEIIYDGI